MLTQHRRCSILVLPPALYYDVAVFLHFYYYGGVIISWLCIVQHSMFGVMPNLLLLIHFHSILFISWLGHHFKFAMSLHTFQWCYLCNYEFRKNKSPSGFKIEIVATVFFYAYGHCRHCMQEHRVHGIHNETMYYGSASNHSRKEVNGSVTAAAYRESRQQQEIMCPILE